MNQPDRWNTEPTDLVLALRAKLDAGVSLRRAAETVGTSPQTIANWAKGTVTITFTAENQRGLATLLEVKPRRVLELAGFDLGGSRRLAVA